MKKIIFLLLFPLITLCAFAQEPGNNLGKSIAQIKQNFPNLIYSRIDKGYEVYKSKGEDEDFTSFYFSNGRLVSEETFIFDDTSNGNYINHLYSSLALKLLNFNGKVKRRRYSDSDITFFYFSDFIIKVANYRNQLQILYELKGYNINITALQARP